MKPLVKNLAALLLLAGTAPLLVADSAEECPFPAQDVTFFVHGTCGPDGTLRLQTEKDRCGLDQEGAEALGLPIYGDLGASPYDVKQGGWSLTEAITVTVNTDDRGPREVPGQRTCKSSLIDEALTLRCEDTASSELPDQVLASCESVLTPQ